FRFLGTTGIGPGWYCLEVGSGNGAVGAWMADRVGPSGYVLLTDIDPRFMERSAYRRPPHMELRRHDIGTDPLPQQAFDLIHARLVLCHVPQRQKALARLVAALKPRGWLVVEDFADVDDLWITCDVNGGRRLRENTSQFICKIADSRDTTRR